MLAEKMVGHPGRTVTDPAVMARELSAIRSTFIASEGRLSGSRESALVESLRRESTWSFQVIEGGHWPMLTIPNEVADLLDAISSDHQVA